MKNKFLATFILMAASGSTLAANYFPELIVRSRPGFAAKALDDSNTSITTGSEDSDEATAESTAETTETAE